MRLNIFLFSMLIGCVNIQALAQPVSEFLIDSPSGCINDEVGFISLAYGGVVDWAWDFGDGETSDEINPEHFYGEAGSYTVTLVVTDGDGLTDSYSETYIVRPPKADFSLAPDFICGVPANVFFTDESTFPDTWHWNFGDGSTSTLQNPVHAYTDGGTFNVTLTVTDTNFGCVDTHTETVEVSRPIAEIGGLEFGYFGCGPLAVDFEDDSYAEGPGTITEWLWDFGDGETSTEAEPSHVYDLPGIYTVTLTVTNDLGCTATETIPAFVFVIGPNPNFGGDIFFAECPALTVDFTDSTIFGAPLVDWDWDFGDGGTSDLINPTHTYNEYGDFDVTLTVTDIDGCSRTLVFEDYIVIQDIINPVFDSCPDDQTESLSADCDFILPDYTLLATASDNCTDPLVISQVPVPGTVISADQVITFQTIDESDNVGTCSFTVFLSDDIDPTIICPPNQNVSFDGDCAYTLLDYTGVATAEDNCLVPAVTQSPIAGTVITSLQTITLTATDTAGNAEICTFDVIPADDTAPEIVCPADITVNNDPGICGAIVTYGTPVGIDNCSATTAQLAGLTSGSEFPIGTITNTFEVTDGAGFATSCSFDILVIDNENPTITCPDDISVNNDIGDCGAIVVFDDPVFADNCPGSLFTQTAGLTSGVFFPVGTTNNAYDIVDAAGNAASCTFEITVLDNEIPTITCPDNRTTCESTVIYEVAVGTDNCAIESVMMLSGIDSGSEFPLGITINTFEVTDGNGNTAACEMTVERFEVPTVDAGMDQNLSAGFVAQLDANSSDLVTYSWSPPDGLSDPTIINPEASPQITTTYTLTVISPDGCQNSDEVQVSIELEIEINNFLSPNGDGKNDTWDIKGNYLLDACQIQIYDSWGNQVYESTGYNNDWDGTREGEILPQGNYYYVVGCSDDQPLTGSITLIR